MAFTEAANHGVTNSTTPVTVVSAPGSGSRRLVKTITVFNADTVAATVTLRYSDTSGAVTRQLVQSTLAPNQTLIWNDVLVLDTTGRSISAVLSGAITTNQLPFTAHYGDAS